MGENNIVDISNDSSNEVVYESMTNDEIKTIINKAEDSRKTKEITSNLYRFAAGASAEKQLVAEIYPYCFNLITRSAELFDVNKLKDMSECDYIVKFWGRLIELVFTKTGMSPHWGDTFDS
ncbi:hypothetical protein G6F56_011740 [Rhizopus delemar]|nr:hypothetical protein G6F56_011740 [Rhizopus delemar]